LDQTYLGLKEIEKREKGNLPQYNPNIFVYLSILGDIRLWVGPSIELLLSLGDLT